MIDRLKRLQKDRKITRGSRAKLQILSGWDYELKRLSNDDEGHGGWSDDETDC